MRNPEITTLTLVRHTITTANVEGKMAGRWDVSIAPEGEQLARQRSSVFKEKPADVIYASNTKRGIRTAELISGQPESKIIKTDLLLERDYGSLEGDKSPKEVQRDLQVLIDFWRTDFQDRRDKRPVNDMETDRELLDRWHEFKAGVIDKHPGEHVLAVSHCDFIVTVLNKKGICLSPQIEGITNTGFAEMESNPNAKEPTFTVMKINGLVRKKS